MIKKLYAYTHIEIVNKGMLLHMKIIALGFDCITPAKNTLRHERNATVIYATKHAFCVPK